MELEESMQSGAAAVAPVSLEPHRELIDGTWYSTLVRPGQKLSDAEFFRHILAIGKGVIAPQTTGTFRREEMYADEEVGS
jgi:hypothetical protein